MKTSLTIITILLISACGKHPCERADYSTSGMCVITNEYDAPPAVVDVAVRSVEIAFQKVAGETFDLVHELDVSEASVEFTNGQHEMLQSSKDYPNGLSGRQYGTETYIKTKDEDYLNSLVLGHELIHFVVKYLIDEVSDKENSDHSTKWLWFHDADQYSVERVMIHEAKYAYRKIKEKEENVEF